MSLSFKINLFPSFSAPRPRPFLEEPSSTALAHHRPPASACQVLGLLPTEAHSPVSSSFPPPTPWSASSFIFPQQVNNSNSEIYGPSRLIPPAPSFLKECLPWGPQRYLFNLFFIKRGLVAQAGPQRHTRLKMTLNCQASPSPALGVPGTHLAYGVLGNQSPGFARHATSQPSIYNLAPG